MNIKSAEEKERGKLYRENGNFCPITLENAEFLTKKYDRTKCTVE